MKAEYINPFVSALQTTFSTMLSCEIERGALSLREGRQSHYEISGVIGLSGRAAGTVVVSLSREVALGAASKLLLTECKEVDDDVVDAVGELANMVGGSAKAKLEDFNLSLSLPNVIVGENHEIRFPSSAPQIVIPYTCEWGKFALEVGFVPTPEAAAV